MRESELNKISDVLAELRKKSEQDAKSVKTAQNHFHAVSAGLSSNDNGEDQTLADQLLGRYATVLIYASSNICRRIGSRNS